MLIKHKEIPLGINGKQSVRLEKGIIKFETYFKQVPGPFNIHADFECNLKSVECDEGSYTKKYKDHIPCRVPYQFVCIDDRFTKPIAVYRGENVTYEFVQAILKEHKYCRKIMNKHFKKKSNSCSICIKLIDNDAEKVRAHCHVTGKFRGAAHRNYNINFQLTKKVPVIFYNLRGYDSILIFNELDKIDVKINVIPNGLEKYMAFFLIKT